MTGKPCPPGCQCGKHHLTGEHHLSEQHRANMSVSVSSAMHRYWQRRKRTPTGEFGVLCNERIAPLNQTQLVTVGRIAGVVITQPSSTGRPICGRRCEANLDDGPTCAQCGALRGDKVNEGGRQTGFDSSGKGGP